MAGWKDYLKLMTGLTHTLEELTRVKRDKILAELGLQGVALSQMETHSPDEFQMETKRVIEKLRRQYKLFQAASETARNTLEINLRAIERMQAVQAGDAAEAEETRKQHQTDFRA